ncbi:unnamed protein product, partial [Rotaria sp. Silwood2]
MKQRRFKFHQKDKANNQEYIYIELDTKCSCLQSKFYSDA